MIIAAIEQIPLALPFVPEVEPHMHRAVTHRGGQSLCRVTLDTGEVGYGDGGGSDGSWVGRSPVEALTRCGDAGVQMACYDAVGRALGVPAHVLMGERHRARVPFGYWTIDLPPEVLAGQVTRAAALGYRVYKFKCRPWWDPLEQMEAAQRVAPPGFKLWLDFNCHLREVRLALPLLRRLQEYSCVGGFESPIPQRDVDGYRTLRRKLDLPLAVHYGSGACHVVSDPSYDPGASAETQLRRGVADGYVTGGGHVGRLRALDGVLHEFRKPFWIQSVGTALRAAWVAHVASTCREALLSSLACHDLWERDVATAPRPVSGWMPVPDGPGLGVEVDEAAVDALRGTPPEPRRTISTVVYPDAPRWHFAGEQQRHEAFYFGHLPGFLPGIRLEVHTDDGSAGFSELYRRCTSAPVVE